MSDLNRLEQEIGPRGRTKVDSKNRGQVRKYLCALGMPSPEVRTMTMGELSAAYNDTAGDIPAEPDRAIFGIPDPVPATKKADTAMTPKTDTDAKMQQIAALLADLQPASESLTEQQVIDLITKHAARPASLVITRPDVDPVRIDGHQHAALPDLIRMVSAGVHVWLSGPAGSGKTTLAEQTAAGLGLNFYSTGAVTSDFRLMGFVDAKGHTVRTPFREAFEHGGVFLWDEIDASNPNALVAFNQALANGSFAFPDGMVKRHKDFRAIAAANTWGHGPTAEYVGRTRIDGATLDRFACLPINYDESLERALVGPDFESWARTVQKARKAATDHGIKAIISPRATLEGARLIAAGMIRHAVLDAVVRKGMDDNSWNKIQAAL